MATKKTTKVSSKKPTSKKSARKASKKARKNGAKATPRLTTQGRANLMSASAAGLSGEICGDCVRRVIGQQSGRTPKLDDKMSDLFVPCNPDVMSRLAKALRQCSSRPVKILCGMTVRRVMVELCG